MEEAPADFSKKYIPGLRSRAVITVLIADVRLCGGCFDMNPDKIFCREHAGYILETTRDKKKNYSGYAVKNRKIFQWGTF